MPVESCLPALFFFFICAVLYTDHFIKLSVAENYRVKFPLSEANQRKPFFETSQQKTILHVLPCVL